jgi:hypothetical protein
LTSICSLEIAQKGEQPVDSWRVQAVVGSTTCPIHPRSMSGASRGLSDWIVRPGYRMQWRAGYKPLRDHLFDSDTIILPPELYDLYDWKKIKDKNTTTLPPTWTNSDENLNLCFISPYEYKIHSAFTPHRKTQFIKREIRHK